MALESVAYTEALAHVRAKPAPTRFNRAWALALFITDAVMLAAATGLAFLVAQHNWPAAAALNVDRAAWTAAACIAAWLALFHRVGLYRRSFALQVRDEFYCGVTALVLGALPLLVAFTIVPAISSSRAVLLLSLAFAVVTVGIGRSFAHEVHAAATRMRAKRIAIVGTAARIESALDQMDLPAADNVLRLEVDDVESTVDGILPFSIFELDDVPWLRRARDWDCDTLVLTEMLPPRVLPALLRTAAMERFTVAFAAPRFCTQSYGLRIETDGHQALICPRQLYAFGHGPRILKRTFDLFAATLVLLLAAPVMLIAALAILLEDGSPVFYRQERVGLFGKTFEILKFRSMHHDAEKSSGAVWSPAQDARTTRVGRLLRRTSIDELPQLFNVIRGDMSIVGPRPERPIFVEKFRRSLRRYDERHLVRPGITGWAQLNMARKLDPSQAGEKLSHDLWYIENWGLFMDVSIVCKTAAEFLFHRA